MSAKYNVHRTLDAANWTQYIGHNTKPWSLLIVCQAVAEPCYTRKPEVPLCVWSFCASLFRPPGREDNQWGNPPYTQPMVRWTPESMHRRRFVGIYNTIKFKMQWVLDYRCIFCWFNISLSLTLYENLDKSWKFLSLTIFMTLLVNTKYIYIYIYKDALFYSMYWVFLTTPTVLRFFIMGNLGFMFQRIVNELKKLYV